MPPISEPHSDQLEARSGLPGYEVLGVKVQAWTQESLIGFLASLHGRRENFIVGNLNLHGAYCLTEFPWMEEFYHRAGMVYVDGMPIVILGRLKGYPLRRSHRLTCVDFLPDLLARAQREGWHIFHLGGRPEVSETARGEILSRFPRLKITFEHGFFDMTPGSDEALGVLSRIRQAAPDFVFVGMGMGRQERWILENIDSLEVDAVIQIGACLDYVAGAVPTPPRIFGRMGLEGVYRLLREPRRLAYRYLVEPFKLVYRRWLRSRSN